MNIGLHVKYLLFLSSLNESWIFSTDFQKNTKEQISQKSFQWQPSCYVRTDGLKDISDERNSRYSRLFERA
jgi:hypothetical protein